MDGELTVSQNRSLTEHRKNALGECKKPVHSVLERIKDCHAVEDSLIFPLYKKSKSLQHSKEFEAFVEYDANTLKEKRRFTKKQLYPHSLNGMIIRKSDDKIFVYGKTNGLGANYGTIYIWNLDDCSYVKQINVGSMVDDFQIYNGDIYLSKHSPDYKESSIVRIDTEKAENGPNWMEGFYTIYQSNKLCKAFDISGDRKTVLAAEADIIKEIDIASQEQILGMYYFSDSGAIQGIKLSINRKVFVYVTNFGICAYDYKLKRQIFELDLRHLVGNGEKNRKMEIKLHISSNEKYLAVVYGHEARNISGIIVLEIPTGGIIFNKTNMHAHVIDDNDCNFLQSICFSKRQIGKICAEYKKVLLDMIEKDKGQLMASGKGKLLNLREIFEYDSGSFYYSDIWQVLDFETLDFNKIELPKHKEYITEAYISDNIYFFDNNHDFPSGTKTFNYNSIDINRHTYQTFYSFVEDKDKYSQKVLGYNTNDFCRCFSKPKLAEQGGIVFEAPISEIYVFDKDGNIKRKLLNERVLAINNKYIISENNEGKVLNIYTKKLRLIKFINIQNDRRYEKAWFSQNEDSFYVKHYEKGYTRHEINGDNVTSMSIGDENETCSFIENEDGNYIIMKNKDKLSLYNIKKQMGENKVSFDFDNIGKMFDWNWYPNNSESLCYLDNQMRFLVINIDNTRCVFLNPFTFEQIMHLKFLENGKWIFTTQPDDAANCGWFYTNAPELIHVLKSTGKNEFRALNMEDPERKAYIEKYNRDDIVRKCLLDKKKYEEEILKLTRNIQINKELSALKHLLFLEE